MNTDLAQACVDNMKEKLEELSQLKGKSFWVYNEKELMDKSKGIVFPAVGVVYEGMRAIGEQKDTHRIGVSGEAIVSLLLVQRPDNISSSNTKTPAVALLDDIRGQIMGTKSPSGHYWKFVVEAPASEKDGVVIWLQRWSTPVQLVPIAR